MSLEEDEIPILIQTLEEALENAFCDDPDCEHCVLGSVTIEDFVQKLYTKVPKLDIMTDL